MDLMRRGTLWDGIVRTTELALASGALLPVPTEHAFIHDHGIRFFVRVLAGLRRKAEARKEQDAAERRGKQANPFLPPEQDLTVAAVTGTHLAVLNKFNVVERHLLIITRSFEEQETLLTPADLEALWTCMAEFDGLGFYNGGAAGGASQRHKHLQLVPLPLAPEGPAIPMEPLITSALPGEGAIGSSEALPFRHALVRLPGGLWRSPADAAAETFQLYGTMLQHVGMMPPAAQGLTRQSLPYCLLVTREWMLLVPRSSEYVEDISFNSLAYAGSFFVRDRAQLDRLAAIGPMQALAAVALPRGHKG